MKEALAQMMITNFTSQDFQQYLIFQNLNQRLVSLYFGYFSDSRVLTHSWLQVIYLPGDNDIGGEGVDHVTRSKIERFNTNFPNQMENISGNIQFVVVSNACRVKNKDS
jgi:hypothetical protein